MIKNPDPSVASFSNSTSSVYFSIFDKRSRLTLSGHTLINIPRFGPFLGLDMKKDPSFSAFWKVSLGLENSAWIRRWKLATFGGFGGRSPPRKFCQKWSIFPWKKCCGFRWLSSGKTNDFTSNGIFQLVCEILQKTWKIKRFSSSFLLLVYFWEETQWM